jgi:DNA-binding GntR family transcriptional regulator
MDLRSEKSDNETMRINRRLPIVPQVHSTLHHLIVHCVLPPGSPIREKDLSEQMEVSRTPIREALLQLEKEGLVEIYPQSGTRISKISMEEVRESHFIREAMESATVRFAAQQGDSELHKQLNTRLQEFEAALGTAEKIFYSNWMNSFIKPSQSSASRIDSGKSQISQNPTWTVFVT